MPVNDDRIHSLLYADDLVLLASNSADLQLQLDALHVFSSSVKMEVNRDKTKVMVLRNRKRKSRAKPENRKVWTIGGIQLEECEHYKYLGVYVKSNGKFSVHLDKIKEKTQKSYFSLLAKSREWGGFQPRLFLHLFDHTLMPIMTYASEVWGTIEIPKLERLHLSACKYALGVKSSTNTEAVYAELGRVSVKSRLHINILNFYNRLINLDSNRYASKAFRMLTKDSDSGNSNWVSIATSLQSLYDIKSGDSNSIIKFKVQQHFQSCIMEQLNQQLIQDKKLKTYALFKTTFKFETYLDIIPSFKVRSCLSKLRLSAHNLRIETGRFFGNNKIPRIERICEYCKTIGIRVLEDELHFAMECPLFSNTREPMLSKIKEKFPSTRHLTMNNLFIFLMSQEDLNCLAELAIFCKRSFEIREMFQKNQLIS